MKRWSIWIALLYALTLAVLITPAFNFAWVVNMDELFLKGKLKLGLLFGGWENWQYWLVIVILLLNQWALLALPVDVAHKRPARKRSLVFQVAASALSIGILIAGLVIGVSEVVKGSLPDNFGWIFVGVLGICWIFWARVFSTWSRKFEPDDFIRRTCHTLFKGSALQLLVLVPCHIYARNRHECCAGIGTAFGLACGLAVMLVSFGPGIYFLYVGQLKNRKNVRSSAAGEEAASAVQSHDPVALPILAPREKTQSHASRRRLGLEIFVLWLLVCCGAYWLGTNLPDPEEPSLPFPLFGGDVSPASPPKWYYEKGQLEVETLCVDGKHEGPTKAYHKNGKLKSAAVCKGGKLEGSAQWYYENGQLQSELLFKDGKQEGPSKKYYESGKLKDESFFKNGLIEGVSRDYYESGKLKKEGTYKNGMGDGPYKEYDETGKLKAEGCCKEGMRSEPEKRYDGNGKLVPPVQTPAVVRPSVFKVLTVNRKFNFAVINGGLQDGFKMGDKMKVFRSGKDIAAVQVEKLYDAFSAATLMEEDPKQPVVEGDEVRKV